MGQASFVRRVQRTEGATDYVVVVEKGDSSYGAYVPDLPGCVAVAESRAEVMRMIREAIEFHPEGLREQGLPIQAPSSCVETVRVAR
ncbi:MAG: type II toxin-antitoxin system HicB family antitoxin [Burkholderiales bacterium]|nr:MAG: type II toxin-antitoxin system HicB family antitoxin [Burkholderiales bacterium]